MSGAPCLARGHAFVHPSSVLWPCVRTEGAVEVLRVLDHGLVLVPRERALGRRDHKLLDLLELVDAEDAQLVAAVRARLLAEARRIARDVPGQLLRVDPLVEVVGAERLLRRRDQVFVVAFARHLVELLVELGELCDLAHDRLLHEEGRLHRREALGLQEGDAVVDERLVEAHARAHQEKATRAGDLGALDRVGHARHLRAGTG